MRAFATAGSTWHSSSIECARHVGERHGGLFTVIRAPRRVEDDGLAGVEQRRGVIDEPAVGLLGRRFAVEVRVEVDVVIVVVDPAEVLP